MGNRAVITIGQKFNPAAAGVYLHWNGGRASVEGFLKAARLLEYRSPAADPSYSFARLVAVITAFFPDGLSVGVGTCAQLDCDNGDNGTYLIGDDWQIVGRKYHAGPEETNPEKSDAIAAAIVERLQAVQATAAEQDKKERAAA